MIQFIHGNYTLGWRGRGATSPRFAGDGDTTGVVKEESDQKRAIPLVKRNRGGLKRGVGLEDRRPRRGGVGRKIFDDRGDNLQITLCDCAHRGNRPWGRFRTGRRLATANGEMAAATGRLGRSHHSPEKRGLRQQERQSEQRRQQCRGNFHQSCNRLA
jgi:hypothetical protein